MIRICLVLSILSGVFLTLPSQAEEASRAEEPSTVTPQSAVADTQDKAQVLEKRETLIKRAVREYFRETKKKRTEREELITRKRTEREELFTTIVLNVAKGVAIVIAFLVLRAIVAAVGRGVEEEGVEGPFGVFITTSSEDEAAAIGRTLVEEHLAVSSNITPQIRSIYRWQDKIEDEPEFLMIVRTTRGQIPDIISRVAELHSYDVPDIIALPIRRVQEPMKDWIVETPRKKRWWRRS